MSSESRARDPDLPLFDLPLHQEGKGSTEKPATPEKPVSDEAVSGEPVPAAIPPAARPSEVVPAQNLRLFDEEPETAREESPAEELSLDESGETPALADRLLAGLADFAVQVLALAAGAIGALWLDVPPDTTTWPAFLGLAAAFSFLYWVIPLAFWSRTPGMAWVGHSARSLDLEPLSFGQAGWRWVGALLTFTLVGLPQLVALGGRSLTDRVSASTTVVDRVLPFD